MKSESSLYASVFILCTGSYTAPRERRAGTCSAGKNGLWYLVKVAEWPVLGCCGRGLMLSIAGGAYGENSCGRYDGLFRAVCELGLLSGVDLTA